MGLGALAYLTHKELYLLVFAAVPVIETISVILQVASAKLSRKFLGRDWRIFKMAPLHHHFELLGLSEVTVVILFWAVQILISFVFIWFFHV
jgi:phospho-N-acetylmuramoyl-pentapeptide-transferase